MLSTLAERVNPKPPVMIPILSFHWWEGETVREGERIDVVALDVCVSVVMEGKKDEVTLLDRRLWRLIDYRREDRRHF